MYLFHSPWLASSRTRRNRFAQAHYAARPGRYGRGRSSAGGIGRASPGPRRQR